MHSENYYNALLQFGEVFTSDIYVEKSGVFFIDRFLLQIILRTDDKIYSFITSVILLTSELFYINILEVVY